MNDTCDLILAGTKISLTRRVTVAWLQVRRGLNDFVLYHGIRLFGPVMVASGAVAHCNVEDGNVRGGGRDRRTIIVPYRAEESGAGIIKSPGAKLIFSPFPTFCFPTFLFRV